MFGHSLMPGRDDLSLLHSSCCSCVGTEACEPGAPRQQQSDAAAQGTVQSVGTSGHVLPAGPCLTLQEEV